HIDGIPVMFLTADPKRILCPCRDWPVRQGESKSSLLGTAVAEVAEPDHSVSLAAPRKGTPAQEGSQLAQAYLPALALSTQYEGYVEDVSTAARISRSGHRIAIAHFACKLRRPVRRPVTKLFCVLTSFGRWP